MVAREGGGGGGGYDDDNDGIFNHNYFTTFRNFVINSYNIVNISVGFFCRYAWKTP